MSNWPMLIGICAPKLVDYDRHNNSLTKLREKKEKSLSDEKNLFKVCIFRALQVLIKLMSRYDDSLNKISSKPRQTMSCTTQTSRRNSLDSWFSPRNSSIRSSTRSSICSSTYSTSCLKNSMHSRASRPSLPPRTLWKDTRQVPRMHGNRSTSCQSTNALRRLPN